MPQTYGDDRGRHRRGGAARAGRPERRASPAKVVDPPLPDEVTGRELDRAVRAELSSLASDSADLVARHLVMAARLVDDDPDIAVAHAMAAQRRAGRIAAVREAAGIAAYLAGRYGDALAELRAARRLSGSQEHLPLMADCERGLGRPERALELARAPEVASLDQPGKIEMRIVAAGARRDMGQLEAAVLTLAVPELRAKGRAPWLARLRYAYADALVAVGHEDEAKDWFAASVEADEYEETDAAARLAELDGVSFLDLDEATDWDASDDLSRPVETPDA
jgi:tetratricopeptide (TPR) repeat protein